MTFHTLAKTLLLPNGSNRYFKFYRIAALYQVVKSLESAPPSVRLGVNSLMLGAITIYQINAVIYRPGEGKAEPYLLESCCQHTPGVVSGISVPIMYKRGLYFLSDLVLKSGTYHLPDTRPVDLWVLEALYRREGMARIESEFNPAKAVPLSRKRQPVDGKSRLSQMSKKQKAFSVTHPSDRTDAEEAQQGLRKGRTGEISSSDSSDESSNGKEGEPWGNEVRVEGRELAVEVVGHQASSVGVKARRIQKDLASIKHTFAKDVLSCAPHPRGKGSGWMLLSKTEQDSATLAVFASPDFGRVLRQVQCRKLDEENWRTLAFERYFPQQINEESPRQNFTSASYHKTWVSLLHTVDEKTISKITEEVYGWFKDLYWIPLPESDRMWTTKRTKEQSFWTMVPESDVRHLCPRIAINSALGSRLDTHASQ